MKRLFTLFFTFFSISIYSQCELTVFTSDSLICEGDSVFLTTDFTGSNIDFNSGTIPVGWSITGGFTVTSTGCYPPVDGTSYYQAASDGVITPIIQSDTLVSCFGAITSGFLDFDMIFSQQAGFCDGPDLANEGVSVQYSTDGGMSWIDIIYFSPGGFTLPSNPGTFGSVAAGPTAYTVWNSHSLPIPPGALVPGVIFRWAQLFSSAAPFDNWAIDNISINTSTSLTYTWSTGASGVDLDSIMVYNLVSDTLIFCTISNPITGISYTDSIFIDVVAEPDFILAYDNRLCDDDLFSIINTSTPSSGVIYSYDFDNNGTFETITSSTYSPPLNTHFATPGVYTFQVQVANGSCIKSIDTTIIVYPEPIPNITSSPINICEGNPANLNALFILASPIGAASTVTSFAWDFTNDGIIDSSGGLSFQNVSFTYPSSGTYVAEVTLTTDQGCIGTDTLVINVLEPPAGNINPNEACQNSAANFVFNNTNGIPVSNYQWNFGITPGTNSITPAPSFAYTTAGTYTVTLILTGSNTCRDTIIETIQINPIPEGTINFAEVCENASVEFGFTPASGTTVPINIFDWTFSSGSPGTSSNATPDISYGSSGSYPVSLTITNDEGCSNFVTSNITVHPSPNASFTSENICLTRYTFTNTSTPLDSIALTQWNFGGDVLLNPSNQFNYSFQNGGTFDVTLYIEDENGCRDSVTNTLTMQDTISLKIPNILVKSSSQGNEKFNFNEIKEDFNLCVDYNFYVFDRWGVLVFETTNNTDSPDINCDRCFKGKSNTESDLSPGTYYYVMEGNYNNTYKGFIQIFD